MKKILILMILLLPHFGVIAQSIEDVGKISLCVEILDGATRDTKLLKPQLVNTLSQVATRAGYSSFGNGLFIIYPNIVIENVDMAEGGMKNLFVVNGKLFISIQERYNKTVFQTLSLPIRGSATTKENAIKNSITNLDFTPILEPLSTAKVKILRHYEDKQGMIFAKADTYIIDKQYDAAISCLLSIPEELPSLYKAALTKANAVYELKQTEELRLQELKLAQNNAEIINNAKSLIAMHKPVDALITLWAFTVGNEGQDEVCKTLMSQAESMITEKELEIIRKEQRDYEDKRANEIHHLSIAERQQNHTIEMEQEQMNALKSQLLNNALPDQQRVDIIKLIAYKYLQN